MKHLRRFAEVRSPEDIAEKAALTRAPNSDCLCLAMKLLIVILVLIWFLCGLGGAWRLDDMRLKTIARGPLTLAEAFDEDPVTYPGPG